MVLLKFLIISKKKNQTKKTKNDCYAVCIEQGLFKYKVTRILSMNVYFKIKISHPLRFECLIESYNELNIYYRFM